jgi:RNA polymerase sigma-70 factor (ECF subfamily)
MNACRRGRIRKNRYDCLDPFAAMLVRKKAHQLVGRSGFVREDVNDLEQELAIDLLERCKKYDASRASLNTFTSRVVDHKIASLLEAQRAARRDFRKVARELASDNEAGTAEVISLADALATAANDDHDNALRVDVRGVLERLDPSQRELCEGLASSTISELARKTGRTRAVLYEAKAKLVDHFERAGLRVYFESADRSGSAPVGISMPIARSRR